MIPIDKYFNHIIKNMNNMIVDNFKERREIKIENDANIKNQIFK